MAARLPLRLLARHAGAQRSTRCFSSASRNLEAHNFMMPAMSPTMTEGNIASWKVKEGDSFSVGDVLLEIETDKASMDVEAQDDGVMAKIFAQDGAKSVKVGTRIAVLADPGDDVSSISIPEDDSKPAQSEKPKEEKKKEEKKADAPATKSASEEKKPAQKKSKPSPKGSGQNPKYPLYPAVQALIQQNNISDSDVAKIAATGPQGRMLKGDVLAYLGSLSSGDYSKAQSDRIEKLGHLDLSNIKAHSTKKAPDSAAAAQDKAAALPQTQTIALSISLAEVLKVQKRVQDTLGTTVPLSSFLARAVDFANDDLPLPAGAKPSADDLFNAVLGLDAIPTASRGTYLPQIDALPPSALLPKRSTRPAKKPVDIIDLLSGKVKSVRSVYGRVALANPPPTNITTAGGANNIFSLTVPVGEEKRARVFLERVKTLLQLEPGKLIL